MNKKAYITLLVLPAVFLTNCNKTSKDRANFLAQFKIFSDTFQKSNKEYALDKITIKNQNGFEFPITKREYTTNPRTFSIVVYGITGYFAGSTYYTYYEDEDKGFKKELKERESECSKCTYTYSNTEVDFKGYKSDGTLYNHLKFNNEGYMIEYQWGNEIYFMSYQN